MTVFTTTWDTPFEGIPGDNENVSAGAGEIRALKVSIRQRMAVDHSWNGNAADGVHGRVSLAIAPGLVGSADPLQYGALFGQRVGGLAELCWTDLSGNTTVLTNGGKLNATNGGVSGGRPVNPQIGFVYFDLGIGRPVFWSGVDWRDATGGLV